MGARGRRTVRLRRGLGRALTGGMKYKGRRLDRTREGPLVDDGERMRDLGWETKERDPVWENREGGWDEPSVCLVCWSLSGCFLANGWHAPKVN